MRITTIDIGTNTMLMLIGELDKLSSQIHTILDIQRVPRLGKGVDADKNISGDSIQKAIEILSDYKKISKEYNSNKIIATATSFLRDANNKNEFIEKIKKETGIEIEILSGDDEARWAFWGGVYDQLQIPNEKLQICIVDIGGGSTEITVGYNIPVKLDKNTFLSHPIQGISLDIGSVRLKEKFLHIQPPSNEDIIKAEESINENLGKIKFDLRDTSLVGIAGTVTTLAAVKTGLRIFDKEAVDNISLSTGDINNLVNDFSSKTVNQLNSMGDYMEGRSDIILPGTLILKAFMDKFGFDNLTVSTKGLRYGILLREMLSH